MLIQFILIAVIALIVIRLIYRWRKKSIKAIEFWGWLLLWVVAVIIIWQPDITSWLALKVGVTRGVDLVLYVSIILLFYMLFKIIARLEKMEGDITKMVRKIALKDEDKK